MLVKLLMTVRTSVKPMGFVVFVGGSNVVVL